jgi:hypothetical protein
MTREEKERAEETIIRAVEACDNFRNTDMEVDNYMMVEIKNIIINGKTNISLNVNNNKKDRALYIGIFRYYLENILELDVASFDSIYTTDLISRLHMRTLVEKIVSMATEEEVISGQFNRKYTLLKMTYPDYYEKNYKQTIPAYDIFTAHGELLRDMQHAGKAKMVNDGQRTKNYGAVVDRLVYNSINVNLPPIFTVKDKTTQKMKKPSEQDILSILAAPKKNHLNRYGFIKIIESRQTYPSALDFYFWNSPDDFQYRNFKHYLGLRKEMELPHVEVLDIYEEVFRESEASKGHAFPADAEKPAEKER